MSTTLTKRGLSLCFSAACALLLASCGGGEDEGATGDAGGDARLNGTVAIDGSSTVFPISEAMAEEFLAVHPRVRVTVGVSGTGGGFQKFLAGEIDINDASREIRPSEAEKAETNGIEYIEVPVAFDGLSVVVNPANDWVDHLTVEELERIWQPGSTVETWSDVRPEWPEEEIRLYGPGTDSGTFDYFTEAIMGESGAARPDYTASEDDNVLVQGITGDEYSLGFFGYAYYEANEGSIKIVPIDSGEGPVEPTPTTINDDSYNPLSRPIFIYVNKASLQRPEVESFVTFYIENAGMLASEVGYIPLTDEMYEASMGEVREAVAAGAANGSQGN